MSLAVEKLEGSLAKLTIEVPAEELDKAIKDAYNKNKHRFSIPGFRKGKVPQHLIEKMYGPEIFYEDAANELINEHYPEEVENCEEEIVSRPEIDVEQLEKGKPFIFTAVVALKPEIKLGEYKGVEVEKQDTTVSDEDVDKELERVRKENGRKVDITDRAAKLEDEVNIDFEGFIDGEAFEGGKGEGHKLVLGSHSFIDTFEDQIVGKNIGDEFDVNVTFPEEYHAENLAGKPAVFKVKLNAITETELPELDDEFAEEVSEFDTLEAYKADIKKTLEFRKESAAKRAKQEAAIEKIAEAAEVDIPEQMIKYYQENMFNEMTQNLRYQGLDMNMYLKMMKTSKETMLENIKPDAIARIKNSLALDKIAELEGIVASDEEVEEEIKKMAESYMMEADKLKEIMGEKETENIKKEIAARKALEFVADNCKEV
ncbi:MAG: trigger factor [Lachnospiraceae bacterium]|nr:trigger factor [Lachnospiraceae bacterium]